MSCNPALLTRVDTVLLPVVVTKRNVIFSPSASRANLSSATLLPDCPSNVTIGRLPEASAPVETKTIIEKLAVVVFCGLIIEAVR